MVNVRIRLMLILLLFLSFLPTNVLASGPNTIIVDYDRAVYYAYGDGGYTVQNDEVAPMLDAFRQYGGENVLGRPVSRRFQCDAFVCQGFERGILQWQGAVGRGAELLNVMDMLHEIGQDAALEQSLLIPPHATFSEAGFSWQQIVNNRLHILNGRPAMARQFRAAPIQPLQIYGLPTSNVVEHEDRYVLRLQRAIMVEWKLPDSPVEVLAAGAIAREHGLIPEESQSAEAAPEPPTGERWIQVSRSQLRIWAMVGDRAIYSAPITIGQPGRETPLGTYHIFYRVASETMNSETLGVPRTAPGGYYLENVRWTQYFRAGGYALHENYWHPDSVFGRQATSAGCVGMRSADAKFFWDFATIGTRVTIVP